MRRVSIAVLLVLVAGLVLILTEACSPTISAPHAIAIALENALMGSTELGRSETLPTNIEAAQMTLAAAQERATGEKSAFIGGDPNMLVWLVSMEGKWIPSGFISPDSAAQHPLHHCFIIIDAETGNVMGIRATP